MDELSVVRIFFTWLVIYGAIALYDEHENGWYAGCIPEDSLAEFVAANQEELFMQAYGVVWKGQWEEYGGENWERSVRRIEKSKRRMTWLYSVGATVLIFIIAGGL